MAGPPPGESRWYSGITDTIAGLGEKVGDLGKKVLGDNAVTNGYKLSKVMGAPPEPVGGTITGGRRYRKKTAKRHSKKHKTMRSKH